jgi:hypothetical protein
MANDSSIDVAAEIAVKGFWIVGVGGAAIQAYFTEHL